MELVVIAMIVNISAHWYIAVQKFSRYVKVNNNNTPQIYSLLPCNLLLIILPITTMLTYLCYYKIYLQHEFQQKILLSIPLVKG